MEEFEKLSKGSAFHQGHCSLLTHHYSPSHIKCVCPHWTVSKGLRKSQQYKVAKLSAHLSFSFPFLNFSVFLFHLTLLLHLLSLFPHSSAELSLPAYFSVFRMASPHPPWSLSLVQHFLLVSLVSLSRGLPPFFPSSFHFLNFSSSALFLTLPQICTLVIFSVSVFSVPLELFLLLPSASFPPALLLFTYPSAVTSASTHFLPLFHFLSPSFFSTHDKHKVCALGSTTTQKWNCTHAFRLIKL